MRGGICKQTYFSPPLHIQFICSSVPGGGGGGGVENGRCCYKTEDVATAATQNGVCVTQPMCHVMILVYDCSMIKDESNKKILCFSSFSG